jgi:DNA-binding IclR family transcriptional regulator
MSEPRASAPPKLVGALVSGLGVLRYLARNRGPTGVTRIARDLDLNASTCFNLLRTLVHEGLVTFDDETKSYAIGLGVVELAQGALDRASLVKLVEPHLNAIAVHHEVTVVMWQALNSERMALVHVAENHNAIRVQMTVGTRIPTFAGASGRCMAAFSGMTKAEIRSRFGALRWDSAPSFEDYWASVVKTRERGYAIDDGQYQRGATILAVPVFDPSRKPTMTIGGASFTTQLDAARIKALAGDLGALAERVTRALSGGATVGDSAAG